MLNLLVCYFKASNYIAAHTSSTLTPGGKGLTVADLAASLTPSVKKQMKALQSKSITATLSAPLATTEANKITRQVHYEHVVKDVSKWQDVVKVYLCKLKIRM